MTYHCALLPLIVLGDHNCLPLTAARAMTVRLSVRAIHVSFTPASACPFPRPTTSHPRPQLVARACLSRHAPIAHFAQVRIRFLLYAVRDRPLCRLFVGYRSLTHGDGFFSFSPSSSLLLLLLLRPGHWLAVAGYNTWRLFQTPVASGSVISNHRNSNSNCLLAVLLELRCNKYMCFGFRLCFKFSKP